MFVVLCSGSCLCGCSSVFVVLVLVGCLCRPCLCRCSSLSL